VRLPLTFAGMEGVEFRIMLTPNAEKSIMFRKEKTPQHFWSAFFRTLGIIDSIFFVTELRPKIVPLNKVEGAIP